MYGLKHSFDLPHWRCSHSCPSTPGSRCCCCCLCCAVTRRSVGLSPGAKGQPPRRILLLLCPASHHIQSLTAHHIHRHTQTRPSQPRHAHMSPSPTLAGWAESLTHPARVDSQTRPKQSRQNTTHTHTQYGAQTAHNGQHTCTRPPPLPTPGCANDGQRLTRRRTRRRHTLMTHLARQGRGGSENRSAALSGPQLPTQSHAATPSMRLRPPPAAG